MLQQKHKSDEKSTLSLFFLSQVSPFHNDDNKNTLFKATAVEYTIHILNRIFFVTIY